MCSLHEGMSIQVFLQKINNDHIGLTIWKFIDINKGLLITVSVSNPPRTWKRMGLNSHLPDPLLVARGLTPKILTTAVVILTGLHHMPKMHILIRELPLFHFFYYMLMYTQLLEQEYGALWNGDMCKYNSPTRTSCGSPLQSIQIFVAHRHPGPLLPDHLAKFKRPQVLPLLKEIWPNILIFQIAHSNFALKVLILLYPPPQNPSGSRLPNYQNQNGA